MNGFLVAFEGLDQSGKQTQAEHLKRFVESRGRECQLVSFPVYETAIGQEIHRALHGGREYGADVLQLLYIANRYERKPEIERWLENGTIVICDRYLASSIAYGEAQGLDAAWLAETQRLLPPPAVTFLLDIAPETAAQRKRTNRDRYERDLALLARVRQSYQRQAGQDGWVRLDGERSREAVTADVVKAVEPRLARR